MFLAVLLLFSSRIFLDCTRESFKTLVMIPMQLYQLFLSDILMGICININPVYVGFWVCPCLFVCLFVFACILMSKFCSVSQCLCADVLACVTLFSTSFLMPLLCLLDAWATSITSLGACLLCFPCVCVCLFVSVATFVVFCCCVACAPRADTRFVF